MTLSATALDTAKELGINISAVAEGALLKAISEARKQAWLKENAQAFEAQAAWHKENGHPVQPPIFAHSFLVSLIGFL
ncbi:MAG: type II toxin-antitoxin system CcdA family antitoxin, partial [Paracoccaceae bacterium]